MEDSQAQDAKPAKHMPAKDISDQQVSLKEPSRDTLADRTESHDPQSEETGSQNELE